MKSIFITVLSLFIFHDYHVSQTSVYYNSAKESIEITLKVAIEDLETALEDQGAKSLNIGASNENEKAELLIENYLKRHLKLYPNNRPMSYNWVGKEMSEDLHDLYIYLEIADCNEQGDIKVLGIENSIFTELHANQSNTVLVEFEKTKRTLTFTKDRKKQNIDLTK